MFRATALLALLPAAALGFMAPALPMGSMVRHGSIAGAAAPSSLLLRSDRVKAASSGAVAGARMAGLKCIGFPELQAKGMRVGIVHSRWNAEVVVSRLRPLPLPCWPQAPMQIRPPLAARPAFAG